MANNPPNIPSNFSVPPSFEGINRNYKRAIYEGLFYNSLPMLLRYSDRNSMAFSREVRLPFLDHRLVAIILSRTDINFFFKTDTKQQIISILSESNLSTMKKKIGFRSYLWRNTNLKFKNLWFSRLRFDARGKSSHFCVLKKCLTAN